MAEYIEKAGLYQKVSHLEELARNRYLDTPSGSPVKERYRTQMDERTRFKHMLADTRAANVAQVVHSSWVQVNNTQEHYCNECGAEFNLYAYCKDLYHYCPNCGALMDRE